MPSEFLGLNALDALRASSFQPDFDPVVGKAISIVKFLNLAEKAGEISHDQSSRLATQLYNAMRDAGYNLPLLAQKPPRDEIETLPQTAFRPEASPVPYEPIETPVDPIYEWINAQGGLDNVLKAIQKNSWADTSSWEKDGRRFTVADIKRLGKT